MFKPNGNTDRRDYGEMLMLPPGYRLDAAVGTTYSLDLESLTAVAICLGLAQDADSSLMQNPISMLHALQKVSDRIVIFCEAGQIKMPGNPSALSLLLEKMVIPVALKQDKKTGFYPAFHPKTWTLAYVNDKGEHKYRYIVLSRNLTFDRSWDICFAMDGEPKAEPDEKTRPIIDFLEYLKTKIHNTQHEYARKRALVRKLTKELQSVSFSLNSKEFGDEFQIMPMGIGKNAYNMSEDPLFCDKKYSADSTFNELVIMSPFLSGSIIESFNQSYRSLNECSRTLITRESELGKIKPTQADNFDIYVLKDEMFDREDLTSDEDMEKCGQDIHAKIFIRRKYSDTDLYLGSMNASYAALHKNVEMMVRLHAKNHNFNGQKFLDDVFCGPADAKGNPFEKVDLEKEKQSTDADESKILERKIKEICRLKMRATVEASDGKYNVSITTEGAVPDKEIVIAPFMLKQGKVLDTNVVFENLELLQLSEFYEITAEGKDVTLHRVIMIPTAGMPSDRDSAVVNSVIKDRTAFVDYVAFVLGDDYISTLMEEKELGESGFYRQSGNAMPALYEKMLRISTEDPARLKDIRYVLNMVTDKDIIPDEFRQTYEMFCQTLNIK